MKEFKMQYECNFDSTSNMHWMYAQQKRQEKKQAKEMRSMRQSKKDHWNNIMESV